MPVAVVLCLPVREDDGTLTVLLGRKKKGFGRGKTVAPGGKIEAGETPAEAAARELAEETSLIVDPRDLEDVASIAFRFPARPASDMDCVVFLARAADGVARASDELEPMWCRADALPTAAMWDDSSRWLPELLAGRRLDVTVVLGSDNETVAAYTAVDRTDADPGPVPPAGRNGRRTAVPGARA
ncbi:MAG: NUDIX domain-containing protein [Arthrobacter sp.]|uniref:8-oxo-dGTP diphosphatase n=1 Tax=Arthrobacter sp. TaxID=1667 RepID=UPI003497A321